jgi:hypothetical protein
MSQEELRRVEVLARVQPLMLRRTFDQQNKLLALNYSVFGGSCSGESGTVILVERNE